MAVTRYSSFRKGLGARPYVRWVHICDAEADLPDALAAASETELGYCVAEDTNWRVESGAWVAVGGGGTAGPEGPMGPQGPAGADGPQGPQGIQGPQGLQGPAGADGSAGAQGPQGIQGPAGANGAGVGGQVKITADVVSSVTSLADVTGLSLPVLANRTYAFTFWIRFSTAALTTGAQYALNAPANTFLTYRTETSLTAAAAGAPTYRTARAVNIGSASASVDAIGGDLLCVIQGIIRPTAGGNIQVRHATEVAASNLTTKLGSCGVLFDYGT